MTWSLWLAIGVFLLVHALVWRGRMAAARRHRLKCEAFDQSIARRIQGEMDIPEGRCRVCGCTDAFGCFEGCWWAEKPTENEEGELLGLCSSCAPRGETA